MTNFKSGLVVLVIVGVITAFVIQHQAQEKLRGKNEELRRQISQLQSDNLNLSRREAAAKLMLRLPAPHIQAAAAEPPIGDLQPTNANLYARQDKVQKLTAAQVEAYLKANRTNAASLLAAYRTSGNPALLREAMKKYPDDPQVDFEAVFNKDLSSAEQRQWLNAFEQSAPDNALANYLSALNDFKAGQPDQAVQELIAASGKQQFQDYTVNRIQDDEEAYLSAGYSAAEAEDFAIHQLPLLSTYETGWPYALRQLGNEMTELAKAYQQEGDETSTQAALQMAASLGQRLDGSPSVTLASQLVGLYDERMALSLMDPDSLYGANGQTVQDRLNEIAQQKAALRDLGEQAAPLMQTMSEQDWLNYRDRQMLFGEVAALRWVVSKYGQK